jgi:hypothetical protein
MRNLRTYATLSLIFLSACGGDGGTASGASSLSEGLAPNLTANSGTAQCVPTAVPFGSGSGTNQDPFTICTAAQLWALNSIPNSTAHFLITSDINANSLSFPISALSGTLDGGGHTITNVHQYNVNMSNAGFVGENTGTIKNLTLAGVVIYGTETVGGVAGINYGTLDQITISGSVPSSNAGDQVGGIAGVNRGTISNSFTDLSVVGNDAVGGIVGNFQGGLITNVTASGSVSGQLHVGGGIGYNDIKVSDGGTGAGTVSHVTIQSTYSSGVGSPGCMNGFVTGSAIFTGNSC